MPSRIIHRDRVIWWSQDFARSDWSKGVPRGKDGGVKDCATAIPPRSTSSPFRAGLGLFDSEEGIAYRCVTHLDPLDGWAETEFWQKRWRCDHRSVVAYVEAGFLDAAVIASSQVKRYRCRDEHRLLASATHKKQKRRLSLARYNAKRVKRAKLREAGWG